jgi:hypothetical protein
MQGISYPCNISEFTHTWNFKFKLNIKIFSILLPQEAVKLANPTVIKCKLFLWSLHLGTCSLATLDKTPKLFLYRRLLLISIRSNVRKVQNYVKHVATNLLIGEELLPNHTDDAK